MSWVIKLRDKLKQPSSSRKERLVWFLGLYAVSVLAIIAVTSLIHVLVALLIKI